MNKVEGFSDMKNLAEKIRDEGLKRKVDFLDVAILGFHWMEEGQ